MAEASDISYPEFHQRVRERRSRAYVSPKRVAINLLLLLLPAFAAGVLIAVALETYCLSLILLYFILPMFYTVEKRIRYDITGIGKPGFSYADGYRDFFRKNMGGLFGVIIALLYTVFLILAFYMIFQYTLQPLVYCFDNAAEVYDEYIALYYSGGNYSDYLFTNIGALTAPMEIMAALTFFIPSCLLVFYFINNNISHHFISTIVLPDIDLNVSASSARSISKSTYGRTIRGHRARETFYHNWPYYVAYTLIYAGLTYLFTLFEVSNVYWLMVYVMIVPTLSIFIGIFLNYFCIVNEYSVIEESKDILLSRMDSAVRVSVYQTYCNPTYQHADESAARGSFVPEPTYEEQQAYNERYRQQRPYYGPGSGDYYDQQQPPRNSGRPDDTFDQRDAYKDYDNSQNDSYSSSDNNDSYTNTSGSSSQSDDGGEGIVIDLTQQDEDKDN